MFSLKKAFDFSWKEFIKSPIFYIGAATLVIAPPVLVGFFLAALIGLAQLSSRVSPSNISLFLILSLVLITITSVLKIGMINISLKAKKGRNFGYGDFLQKSHLFFRLIIGIIIYSLIIILPVYLLLLLGSSIQGVVGSFLIVLGYFSIFFPGLFLALRMFLFDYFIVDKEISPISSLKESFKVTKGSGSKIFLFLLLLISIFSIISTAFLILGIVLALSIFYLSKAFIYKELTKS